jgi:Sec-independent protein translocase protein TatA
VQLMQQWTRIKESEAESDMNLALVVDAELFRLDALVRWLDAADGRIKRAAAETPDAPDTKAAAETPDTKAAEETPDAKAAKDATDAADTPGTASVTGPPPPSLPRRRRRAGAGR